MPSPPFSELRGAASAGRCERKSQEHQQSFDAAEKTGKIESVFRET
jgi:hypothetical protein